MAMACTIHSKSGETQCRKSSGMAGRFGKLVLCLVAIWVFMFHLAPWMEQSPMVQPLVKFIDERDINANMYFYTEVEEFSEANINMDNTMKYMPVINKP
jgi:hypothetical protein